ncbi:hypothetical protein K443DRAFT_107695 [Laccaria amethystina LaAM-08-1]|uniref:Uncharacterized protein n=1 Tax=Laccaria amethystina LaAM-08-1 TaxID=1095629 RepID=A0A0C9WKB3_9AGAR|nr:hypothetical protein K443DRAFT_107695 [Laccaria amethystina LaAM-08-1]
MPTAILRSTFLLLTLLTLSSAVLVNRTIDDEYGDPITSTFPVYSPIGDWQQGANCSDCAIKPDVSKAFDGTWHDSTFYPDSTPKSVSVTFNGVAVYAFFITSPVLTTTTTTQTHLNFTLDNALIGAYDFTPDASSTYTYNHSVFSKTGLSNGEHTLVMTTGGTTAALLLFDYVIYTRTFDFHVPRISRILHLGFIFRNGYRIFVYQVLWSVIKDKISKDRSYRQWGAMVGTGTFLRQLCRSCH